MPATATYAYDPQASASLRAQPDAASAAVAGERKGAGGERVVGVFRFRHSCAVKVTMAGDRFFAQRLRSLDKPDPSRYGEPRQAEYQKAAREFEARWRAVPPEDRGALYPHRLEAVKDGGTSAGAVRRN